MRLRYQAITEAETSDRKSGTRTWYGHSPLQLLAAHRLDRNGCTAKSQAARLLTPTDLCHSVGQCIRATAATLQILACVRQRENGLRWPLAL